MEERLAELNRVVGVRGSFICGGDGQVLAQATPDAIQSAQIALVAAVVSQTFQALGMSGNRVSEMDLVFGQGRLIIKNLRGGVLVLLCDRTINLPLVNLKASAVAKKLGAELKSGGRSPASRPRSARAGELPAAPRAIVSEPIPPSVDHERFSESPYAMKGQSAETARGTTPTPEPAPSKEERLAENREESIDNPVVVPRGADVHPAPAARDDGPLARRLKRLGEKSNGEALAHTSTMIELRPPTELVAFQEREMAPSEEQAGAEGYSEPKETSEGRAETSDEITVSLLPPELLEPDREARRLVQAAAKSRLTLRAVGTLAIHWHCRNPHTWLRVPAQFRTLEFCGLAREAAELHKCLSGLGYQPDQRFNSLFPKRRLTFDAQGWRYQVQVYLDAFDANQRLDISRHLGDDPFSLSPTLLFLERLQTTDMTEDGLRELSALCLDHELQEDGSAPGMINLSFIRDLCADDWICFKTALVNLAKLRNGSAAWLDRAEAERLEEWLGRLRSSIEKAPKSLRWRMQALRGEFKR